MTTRQYTVTHPITDDSTNEPMEIETWSNDSEDSEDSMVLVKEPLQNPIYQVTHQPAVIRNPRTGRYISTTSRAYNELTRGVYQTPTEKRVTASRDNDQDGMKQERPLSKMDELWASHGF